MSLNRTRADLARLARDLRGVVETERELKKTGTAFQPAVAHDFALTMADAIDGYLGGKHKSIEHALGLVRPGKPPQLIDKNLEIVVDALCMRASAGTRACPTWDQVCDTLQERGIEIDKRRLQKLCASYHDAAMAHLRDLAKGRAR